MHENMQKKLGPCSTGSLSQGQFHNGFCVVIPLGPFFLEITWIYYQKLPENVARNNIIIENA